MNALDIEKTRAEEIIYRHFGETCIYHLRLHIVEIGMLNGNTAYMITEGVYEAKRYGPLYSVVFVESRDDGSTFKKDEMFQLFSSLEQARRYIEDLGEMI